MTAAPTGPGDLDSASSAPLHPAAREVLLAALDRGYADPRRLHRAGREARLLLDNAREATADALGVRPDEVTFTPSGTHAVHLGLLGLVRGSRRGDGVVHSAVEHSAVRHAVAWGARSVEVGVSIDYLRAAVLLPKLPRLEIEEQQKRREMLDSWGRLPLDRLPITHMKSELKPYEKSLAAVDRAARAH